mmetsp:Transcript_88783/g.160063  ORF Transcript_88783/g.160063 Transcript_88783/m.160063 type:complete len:217 (-) Transcript_88783:774-1424(-)
MSRKWRWVYPSHTSEIFCLWQRMLMSQRHAKVELRQANCTPCQAQTQIWDRALELKPSEVLCHEPLLPPDSLGTRDRLPRHFPPRFLLTTATTPTTATTTSLSPGAGGGGAAGRAAQATGWAAAGVHAVPLWKGCPGKASASRQQRWCRRARYPGAACTELRPISRARACVAAVLSWKEKTRAAHFILGCRRNRSGSHWGWHRRRRSRRASQIGAA